jgi:hypothetical protein
VGVQLLCRFTSAAIYQKILLDNKRIKFLNIHLHNQERTLKEITNKIHKYLNILGLLRLCQSKYENKRKKTTTKTTTTTKQQKP